MRCHCGSTVIRVETGDDRLGLSVWFTCSVTSCEQNNRILPNSFDPTIFIPRWSGNVGCRYRKSNTRSGCHLATDLALQFHVTKEWKSSRGTD